MHIGSALFILCYIVVFISLLQYWMRNFKNLMSLKSEDLSDKYDKIIFAIVMILFNVLGAYMFSQWYKDFQKRKLFKRMKELDKNTNEGEDKNGIL